MSGATSKGRKGTALGRIRQLMAIARKKALAPCPSTGSVTATTIKSQSSSSLAHRQFMPVCVLPLMGWIKALYRRARRTRHLGGQLKSLNRLRAEALATLPLASMPVR
jgi:hypothetical protein